VDVTVYLPDDIRQKAKDHGIVLSRFLRDALNTEFARLEAIERALDGAKEVLLTLEDENGRPYRGRFTATRIGESDDREVYLTDDETVIVYEPDQRRYSVIQDAETELREWLPEDTSYIAAMNALGIMPTVDLIF
jgi:post-segregation antitoxin (ccd killing protein)